MSNNEVHVQKSFDLRWIITDLFGADIVAEGKEEDQGSENNNANDLMCGVEILALLFISVHVKTLSR